MRRDVVAKRGDNMAIVDFDRNLFGKNLYRAGLLKIKMVPQVYCERIGTYDNEAEARDAAVEALSNGK